MFRSCKIKDLFLSGILTKVGVNNLENQHAVYVSKRHWDLPLTDSRTKCHVRDVADAKFDK